MPHNSSFQSLTDDADLRNAYLISFDLPDGSGFSASEGNALMANDAMAALRDWAGLDDDAPPVKAGNVLTAMHGVGQVVGVTGDDEETRVEWEISHVVDPDHPDQHHPFTNLDYDLVLSDTGRTQFHWRLLGPMPDTAMMHLYVHHGDYDRNVLPLVLRVRLLKPGHGIKYGVDFRDN